MSSPFGEGKRQKAKGRRQKGRLAEVLCCLWLAAAAGPAAASGGQGGAYLLEAGPAAAASERDLSGQSLWQMAGSLAIVVGLLLAASHLTRRYLGSRLGLGQQGARLRIAQTLPLGGRRFLSLVEVDGQGLLLGISAERIELLHVLDAGPRFQLPEEEPRCAVP